MKRIFNPLLYLLFLFLVSCSVDKNTTQINDNLHFLVSELETKGRPINSYLNIPNMSVYGYYTGDGVSNSWANVGSQATPNFLNAYELINNAGVLSATNMVFWPNETSANISFFAYSPIASSSNGISVAQTTGTPTLNYTIPTDVTNQPDLMVAVPKFDLNISNGSEVKFSMNHALTSVGFRVAGSGEVVKGMKISGIRTSATLSMDGTNIVWSNLGVLTNTEFSAGVNPTTTTSTMTSLMQGNGYLMMIPQNLDASTKLTITMGDNSTREISLASEAAWEAGKTIYYNVFFSQDGILTIRPKEKVIKNNQSNIYKIRVVCKDSNGDANPYMAWTINASNSWLRLSLTQSGFAGASQTLSGVGSKTVYLYASYNNTNAHRTTNIIHDGLVVSSVKQLKK